MPGDDLRSKGDAIIHGFEKELVNMRKEIVIEAEDLMLSICEAALEKRRVKLRDRHRLATSVDEMKTMLSKTPLDRESYNS